MPMNGRILLATSVAIALLSGDAAVTERLLQAREVYLPIIALGELYLGALKSQRTNDNVARIDELASGVGLRGCDMETARGYAAIKNRLRIQGKPIPENDVWIAAIARQHGLTLVTRDAHFAVVEGLSSETW